MIWLVIVAIVIAVAVCGALLLALSRSAATDSASVSEEYQEFLKAKELKAASEDDAEETHGAPDESPA